jgi:hypothetical protein
MSDRMGTGTLKRFDFASLAWIGLLMILAGLLWSLAVHQTLADYWPAAAIREVRDDAEIIIGRFGFPETDAATESLSGADTRMLTYRDRGVRVAFVRRATRKAQSAWKLTGFFDLHRDLHVAGEEAWRRLNGR